MRNPKSLVRIALLAFSLFGAMIWLAQPSRHARPAEHDTAWELRLEFAGGFDGLAYDYAVVRDTLDHHFALLASGYPALDYDWKFEGAQPQAGSSDFRSEMRLHFKAEGERSAFLRRLLQDPRLAIALDQANGLYALGQADFSLPIPGRGDALLHMQGWRFRVTAMRSQQPLLPQA